MPGPGVFIGTSGWIYPHWRDRFYPPGLSKTKWLEFLGSRLSTVEVNATFYSLTTPRACDRWRESVPPGFVFALKGSRYITHLRKLRDPDAALANFFASGILRLGAQLGPVLWQLPPQLPFQRDLAEGFLSRLPFDVRSAERLARRHDDRVAGRESLAAPDGRDRRVLYALEARHASWMQSEAVDLLRHWNVALVWADTAGEHPATTAQTTDLLAYVRLHGSQRTYEGHYLEGELESWASRVRAWAREDMPVYVYFDNDREAAAALDAVRLAAMIEGRPATGAPPASALSGLPGEARPRPEHFGFRSRRQPRG